MFEKKKDFVNLRKLGLELSDCYSLKDSLQIITGAIKDLTNSERVSVYLYDKSKKELWTIHADGIQRIVIPIDTGIVGLTFRTEEYYMTNDPDNDPNYFRKVADDAGYKIRNIAAVPIHNSDNEIIGVLQIINKDEGDFNKEDMSAIKFISNFISGFLDLYSLEDATVS